MSKEKNNDDFSSFDEYLRQGEPSQKESAENWKTAIGLQAVDGLQPSAYLIDVAKRNIEGEITLDETRKLIDSYYQSKTVRTPKDEDEEEADKVSANIANGIKHAFNEFQCSEIIIGMHMHPEVSPKFWKATSFPVLSYCLTPVSISLWNAPSL